VYRLTVDQYDRMVDSGVLDEDDPVELLGGVLVRQMPKYPRHIVPTEETRIRLERVVPAGWYVRQEGPVRIPEFDKPEPDVAVARGNIRTYSKRHPGPKDIALVVEVAAAKGSLTQARGEKMSAYARGGIPVYWIINLTRKPGLVEVYTRPTRTGHYRDRVDYKVRDQVLVVIDRREVGRVAVADLLP
jgi:Uma2 family endonuclease